MIWTTPTTELMVIGMAAFCISFGAICTLINCYKWKRKNESEEHEKLRDELLRQKFLTRRRSTSLTSPPSVVNPNYNSSPYKVPTRHLRSTSASYSPTHYLSPHHRRMSTPTHPHPSSCQKSTCTPTLSPSPHLKRRQGNSQRHLSKCNPIYPQDQYQDQLINTKTTSFELESMGNPVLIVSSNESHTTTTTTNYSPSPSPSISKKLLCLNSNEKRSPMGNANHSQIQKNSSKPIPSSQLNNWKNKKCFSFGPIPLPRRDRRGRNSNDNFIYSSTSPASPTSCDYYEYQDGKGNANANEREPLILKSMRNLNLNEKEEREEIRMEKYVMDSEIAEADSNWKNSYQPTSSSSYPSQNLFSKEQIVLEEIPYYIEETDCN